MLEETKQIEFIDNGNAPEFFATGLHEIDIMDSVSRFVFFVIRRTPTGLLYREPVFSLIQPNDSIAAAVAMTIQRMPQIVPAADAFPIARVLH